MILINTATFKKGMGEMPMDTKEVFPKGTSKADYDLLNKVLAAESPSDIKGVATEKLLHLYSISDKLCSVWDEAEPTLRVDWLKHLRSVTARRRIL
jgi:hypothetical protein